MASLDKSTVENLLKNFIDPNVETDLVSAKSVKKLVIDQNDISLVIELGYPAKSYVAELQAQLEARLQALEGVGNVEVKVVINILSHAVQKALKPLPNVKNIIAI